MKRKSSNAQEGDPATLPLSTAGSGPDSVPNNLPYPLTPFIGRSQQVDAVSKLLASERLVTLTGPAGIGKTRLALEVASKRISKYADGVFLIELASIKKPALIPNSLATAFSLQESPKSTMEDALAAYLKRLNVLLVLDNCEHLIQAVADLSDSLLRKTSQLKILATSQEPLSIPGERVYPVPPLSLSKGGESQRKKTPDSEAVRLFFDRAVAIKPDFRSDPVDKKMISEICARLDGIPLAIELAASRVDVFSAHEILQRLDDRFTFLTRGSRTAAARHRSLAAALSWTYDLLSAQEQAFLRLISVFEGGLTNEAAEEVCSVENLGSEQVPEVLEGLVAKSLVMADTTQAMTRFRLLETIRDYARQKLSESPDEESAVRLRHAAWCLAMAEFHRSEMHISSSGGLKALEAEVDNFRTALDWTLSSGRSELTLRLAIAIANFWHSRGYVSEGRDWLRRALQNADQAPPDLRARALAAAAALATVVGDREEAVPALEQSLALSQKTGSPSGIARSLTLLGFARLFENPDSGMRLLEEGVTLAREARDSEVLGYALGMSGRGYISQGKLGEARRCFMEALELASLDQNERARASSTVGLGWVAMMEGDLGTAQQLLRQGLEESRRAGDKYDTALALSLLGEVTSLKGDYEEAEALLEECHRGNDPGTAPFPVGRSLAALARQRLARGDLQQAEDTFNELSSMGQSLFAEQSLLGLAEISWLRGDIEKGRRLLGQTLERAQKKDRFLTARSLHTAGRLNGATGNQEDATALHQQALALQADIGDAVGMTDTLEQLAGIAAMSRRFSMAVRLFGAAESLRASTGYVRRPIDRSCYEAYISRAKQNLGLSRFNQQWSEGSRLSFEEAVAYASRGRGPRRRPTVGWSSLTPTEVQVVAHLKRGLTNKEIAEQLFVSPRTVASHLWRIFSKLGVSSRRELAKKAADKNALGSP